MKPNAENPRPLPLKDQMLQWLDTEEASSAYEAIRAFDLLHHRGYLPEVFNLPPEIAKVSLREQKKWLRNQLPIENMRHAVYLPQRDRLALSTPAQIWNKLLVVPLAIKYDYLDGDKAVFGIAGQVKSTGYKLFVPDWSACAYTGLASKLVSEKELNDYLSEHPDFVPGLKMSIDGFEKKGYTILIPEFTRIGRIQERGKFTLFTNK